MVELEECHHAKQDNKWIDERLKTEMINVW
jgi:hypothetical protein